MLQPLLEVFLLLGTLVPLARCEPKAFSWQPSGYWDGMDGWWSTFYIRVGSPELVARVLPVTSWQETWTVLKEGCPNSTTIDQNIRLTSPDDQEVLCSDSRGQVAEVNGSTSWFPRGIAILDLDRDNLGFSSDDRGLYGQDRLGLGMDDSGVTLNKQVVAGIVTTDWWLGIFGLSNQSTYFDPAFKDPQASFLGTMVNGKNITGTSWGYQAGAHYQLKGVQGLVTFGGYDRSRFSPNTWTTFGNSGLQFTLRDVSYTTSSTYNILDKSERPNALTGYVDSAIPYLYLPNSTVTALVNAFGLEYDQNLNLFTLNSSQHDKLVSLNPSFTITISDNSTSPTVDIKLPYGAFDLKAGQGVTGTNSSIYYFPIRRATSTTGVVLGRAFMQEVYIFNDFDRNTWSIAQAVWKDNYNEDIVTVYKPGTEPASSKSHTGPIVGGVVGGIAVIGGLAILGFFVWKKWKNGDKKEEDDMPEPPYAELGGAGVHSPRYEVDGTGGVGSPIGVGAWGRHNENKTDAIEMDGLSTPLATPATEMEGHSPGSGGRGSFPPNAVVAELDGGPVFLPEMEGSTPGTEDKGFRFGRRSDMPSPPPPPPPSGPPPSGSPPPPPAAHR